MKRFTQEKKTKKPHKYIDEASDTAALTHVVICREHSSH